MELRSIMRFAVFLQRSAWLCLGYLATGGYRLGRCFNLRQPRLARRVIGIIYNEWLDTRVHRFDNRYFNGGIANPSH